MPLAQNLPRYSLAYLPTPLHRLERLSRQLGGPELWIKRDDQTGLATGGNKARKLEYLIGDALRQGCDTVQTTGAAQSNHCRQTAAAAAQAGLTCQLVLSGPAPAQPNGNLLLDRLLGAEIHWTSPDNRLPRLAELAAELQAAGRHPYTITYGGSDPVGATGYAVALEELRGQASSMGLGLSAIVFATSSGGTQAGLIAGAQLLGWDVPILGISVDLKAAVLRELVAGLATRTASHLGLPHAFSAADVEVNDQYLGNGYGVVGANERQAIAAAAQAEGLLLDPVYTGRAFGGLLDLIRQGRFTAGQQVLFWHTGGSPALFAYAADLV